MDLPQGWGITLGIEPGSVVLELWDPDGESVDFTFAPADMDLSDQLIIALDFAIVSATLAGQI